MRTTQGSMLQSLRAVQGFFDANGVQLGGVVKTGAREKLDKAIEELSTHASNQTGSSLDAKGSTQRQRALRKALLRDHMAPIAKIAISELPSTPEMKPLRMPKGRPTSPLLASAAYGMGEVAVKYADKFTSCGLPADFVDRLNAAAAALVNALGDRTQSRGKIRRATTGLKEKLAHGRKIVGILDAFVKSALQDDAPLLAQWNVIKRVQVIPSRTTSAPAPQPE